MHNFVVLYDSLLLYYPNVFFIFLFVVLVVLTLVSVKLIIYSTINVALLIELIRSNRISKKSTFNPILRIYLKVIKKIKAIEKNIKKILILIEKEIFIEK